MRQIFVKRNGFAKREAINAHEVGALAAHHDLSAPQRWIVTHPESGSSVTGGRRFDSLAQAKRFANELQRHLDFTKLNEDAGAWDVQKAFGSENIKRALSAAFQEAYGS